MKNDYSLQTVVPSGRNSSLWGLNILTVCALGPLLYWYLLAPVIEDTTWGAKLYSYFDSDYVATEQAETHVEETWRLVDEDRAIYAWGLNNFRFPDDITTKRFISLRAARTWHDRMFGKTGANEPEYPQCYYNGEWVEPCPE
mgnify:CR=1 FL=1